MPLRWFCCAYPRRSRHGGALYSGITTVKAGQVLAQPFKWITRLDLSRQFMLASLAILLANMAVMGWWVGDQIELGVVHSTAAATALYVDSFVDPLLDELGHQQELSPGRVQALSRLLRDTPLSQYVVLFKIWGTNSQVLYSDDTDVMGKVFPPSAGLVRALRSEVVSEISTLDAAENEGERNRFSELLETYSPVWLPGTDRVIAVVEFYSPTAGLRSEIAEAQSKSWLVVATVTALMYLVLVGLVQRGANTIRRQQRELADNVHHLTLLLGQNEELHGRVRRAATRTTELNERYLRRISAELHDGPAQVLALALLRLESTVGERSGSDAPATQQAEVERIESSLRGALADIRHLSAGLRLPELAPLTLSDTVARVVRAHERASNTVVDLHLVGLPDCAPVAVKITVYRLIQEALSNAFRHAGGRGQRVWVTASGDEVVVQVADDGPGFDPAQEPDGVHLGLVGMRERVESLGGRLYVAAQLGAGVHITAHLPLQLAKEAAADA